MLSKRLEADVQEPTFI